MDEADRTIVMQQFAALSAQIVESTLLKEVGKEGDGNPPGADAADFRIKQVMAEKGITYPDAFNTVRAQSPELFTGVK